MSQTIASKKLRHPSAQSMLTSVALSFCKLKLGRSKPQVPQCRLVKTRKRAWPRMRSCSCHIRSPKTTRQRAQSTPYQSQRREMVTGHHWSHRLRPSVPLNPISGLRTDRNHGTCVFWWHLAPHSLLATICSISRLMVERPSTNP